MKKIKHLALLLWLVPSISVHANSLSPIDETPIDIQFACDYYGEEYNICPELLQAICWKESRYNEKAIDSTGSCYGLMQIKASCHQNRIERLRTEDLYNEYDNIQLGADYLAELFEKYEDAGLVLMIYHGEKNAIQKAENGQISDYANDVLKKSEELERLHGK